MKIINIDLYRDGGTRAVETDEGIYFINSMSMKAFDPENKIAGKVTTEFRKGELVAPDLEVRIIEMADAWEAGQQQMITNGWRPPIQ